MAVIHKLREYLLIFQGQGKAENDHSEQKSIHTREKTVPSTSVKCFKMSISLYILLSSFNLIILMALLFSTLLSLNYGF